MIKIILFIIIFILYFLEIQPLRLSRSIFPLLKKNSLTSFSINSKSSLYSQSLDSLSSTQELKTTSFNYKPENIRNFCIVAHIDHGKSTLTQKLLEYTKKSIHSQTSYVNNKLKAVDSLPSEVSRGITIKSRAIRLEYQARNGEMYLLNLVDTPGHVDFSHEVTRSQFVCEGAILLIDSTQGPQAQTLSLFGQAKERNLKILPIFGKIDMQSARDSDDLTLELEDMVGISFDNPSPHCSAFSDFIRCSSSTGEGIEDLLELIIKEIPPPIPIKESNHSYSLPEDSSKSSYFTNVIKGTEDDPLVCYIFDSYYDTYRGAILSFRVFSGKLSAKDEITFLPSELSYTVNDLGHLHPGEEFSLVSQTGDGNNIKPATISAGEIGYLSANIRDLKNIKAGQFFTLKNPYTEFKSNLTELTNSPQSNRAQTIYSALLNDKSCSDSLSGQQSMIFAGIFPIERKDYTLLRDSLSKLCLNDPSFTYCPSSSSLLGPGFRGSFLGLFHLDIVRERLSEEFGLSLLLTSPSVAYKVYLKNTKKSHEILTKVGSSDSIFQEELYDNTNFSEKNVTKNILDDEAEENLSYLSTRSQEDSIDKNRFKYIVVDNPSKMPDPTIIEAIEEPYVYLTVITPTDYTGNLMELLQNKRGDFIEMKYLSNKIVSLKYEIPLFEIIIGLSDSIKNLSKGFASMSYESSRYRKNDLVKVDIKMNDEIIKPLSFLTPRKYALENSRKLLKNLSKKIKRQQYKLKIYACINNSIINSVSLNSVRKNVIEKCYGGDYSRKLKLLNKQKEGKEKLAKFGKVTIEKEAFLSLLKMNDDENENDED